MTMGADITKPSVIFFNRVYPPERGATGRVLRDLARAFVRDGWEVTVVSSGPLARRGKDGGIHVIVLRAPFRPGSLASYLFIWLKMLLAGLLLARRDLMVTMTDPPLLVVAGRWIARLKGSRHIHWCQDVYPDLLPALGMPISAGAMNFLKKLSRRAMKKCDRIIVIGRCMARQLTHGGVDPRLISVIPNWPEAELRRRPGLDTPQTLRGRKDSDPLLNSGEARFRLLYSGNLGRAHPVRTILAAAITLNKTNPDIEFVFVGDGPQFDRLAAERTRRGLDNMRFLPYQPLRNLRAVLESGDVHLVSMNQSAMGLLVPCKFYAALAVGRPCIFIGPDQAEPARILRDFGAGTAVPPDKPKMLVDIIREYRQNGDLWRAAQVGAAAAGRHFTPQESLRAWLERAREVTEIKRS